MPGEGLPTDSLSNVPELGGGVTSPRHESAEVGRQGKGHYVAGVPGELRALLARLDVP